MLRFVNLCPADFLGTKSDLLAQHYIPKLVSPNFTELLHKFVKCWGLGFKL
jgi:hypothetical protein